MFSDENYKGILDDRAHGVFNGKVYVKRDSQKIEGFQSNQNLLLSDLRQIDAKPELEIYADDVKCSHGTTHRSSWMKRLFTRCVRVVSMRRRRGGC